MILIKSAQIIDGTGKPPFKGDILIKDNRISAIGNFADKKADTIINGSGYIIAPGFIDVNTSSDHYLSLFNNPKQKDFLIQGVTTIIGGQCGSSLAPLYSGSLKSVRRWGRIHQVNVDWTTISELRDTLKRLGLGVNFGTLVGHSTMRHEIAGEESRDLTASEMDVFKKILEDSLDDGALGMSTGLGHVLSQTVSHSELKRLLVIIANKGKVYTTHLRDEFENIVSATEEALIIAKESGVPTIISHLRPAIGYEDKFKEAFELIEKNLDKGNIYFDTNPFDVNVVPVDMMLPKWIQHGNFEVILEELNKEENQKRLIKDFKNSKINLDSLIIAGAKDNSIIVGKTLKEFSKNRGVDSYYGFIKLMQITGVHALVFRKNINMDILREIMFHPRALVGSNSASLKYSAEFLKPERTTNTFPKYLHMAMDKKIPLEESIRKITSLPAKIFGIKERGIIREGWYADLVMLKDNKVTNVLINGKSVVKDRVIKEVLAGDII